MLLINNYFKSDFVLIDFLFRKHVRLLVIIISEYSYFHMQQNTNALRIKPLIILMIVVNGRRYFLLLLLIFICY